MDEEKYQKELFEFEKPKRFFPRLSDFFPKADFERNVILTLTLDKAVFIAIGIIMIVVVVYALGVESGKIRTAENAQQATAEAPKTAKAGVAQPVNVAQAPAVKPVAKQAQSARIPAPVVKAPLAVPAGKVLNQAKVAAPAPVAAPAVLDATRPYTIVAVTFTRKDTAVQEIDKLKKQGYVAALIQSDRYFQVCIGAYKDKTGADSQRDLKKIRRLYKDAYLKMR